MPKSVIQKKSDQARVEILSKLKSQSDIKTSGLISQKADKSATVFPLPKDLLLTFKEELEKVKGHVHLCAGKEELQKTLQEIALQNSWDYIVCIDPHILELFNNSIPIIQNTDSLNTMEVSITSCEYLISRSGSVMISSALPSGRQINIYPPIHCIIAQKSQLVPFLSQAIEGIKEKYKTQLPSHISVITGPSRTADIEKTLVLGAHGPKEFHVFIDLNT